MKYKYRLKQIILILFVMPGVTSCSIEKRKYNSGYSIEWKKTSPPLAKLDERAKNIKSEGTEKNIETESATDITNEPPVQKLPELSASIVSEITPYNEIIEFNQSDRPYKTEAECDNIVKTNGEEIEAIVIEVGTKEIKYKRCTNQDGPEYIIDKSEVLMIKYRNGTKDIITNASSKSQERKTPGLAIAGLITGIVGLIAFGLPLGLMSLIFGSVSLSKIAREPKKYKGKGLAIASIVLGLLNIVLVMILILFLL